MAKIKTANAGVFVVKGGHIFTAVEIQTDIVVMEINGEAPKKTWNRSTKRFTYTPQEHIL